MPVGCMHPRMLRRASWSRMSMVIIVVWRWGVRRRQFRPPIRMIVRIHGGEGAGCQFDGWSAVRSAHGRNKRLRLWVTRFERRPPGRCQLLWQRVCLKQRKINISKRYCHMFQINSLITINYKKVELSVKETLKVEFLNATNSDQRLGISIAKGLNGYKIC